MEQPLINPRRARILGKLMIYFSKQNEEREVKYMEEKVLFLFFKKP